MAAEATGDRVRAAVLHGIRDIRVGERTMPPPAAGQVRIRIEVRSCCPSPAAQTAPVLDTHCSYDPRICCTCSLSVGLSDVEVWVQAVGICGSDLAYYAHGMAGGVLEIDFAKSLVDETGYLGVLGHEAAGIVESVGADVTDIAVGDRVALEAGVPCGACEICRGGKYNLCPSVKFLGSYVNRLPGALQELFNHPASRVFKVPESVSCEEAAMIEPLNVALHAANRAELRIGDGVLITGAGPIGLLTLLVCKAAGAYPIVVSDVVDEKLAKAKELGATHTINVLAGEGSLQERVVKAAGAEVDIAFECSGAEPALASCVYATRKAGKLIVVANQKSPMTNIPLQDICRREIDLRGVFRYRNLYPKAISMLKAGTIDVKPLITHRIELEKVGEGFEALASGKAIKVIISPQAKL